MGNPAQQTGSGPSYPAERKQPRIPLTIEMRCAGAGRAERFISKDLSAVGVFLYTTRVYPVGAQLELAFYVPYHHQEIRAKACVARHSQDAETGLVDGMGLEFTELSETAAGHIARYIERTK